jgi:hypothetical protein
MQAEGKEESPGVYRRNWGGSDPHMGTATITLSLTHNPSLTRIHTVMRRQVGG